MSIPEKLRSFSRAIRGKSCSAVILAAGSGSRFAEGSSDTSLPKQFIPICGKPMIAYSLLAFDACEAVSEIVIVTRGEDIPTTEKILGDLTLTKPYKIVEGGATRQESALIGFNATSEKYSYVAIHDAARPLITAEAAYNVIRAAFVSKAAIAASPSVDTPKIVNARRLIKEKAPDREKLWNAQTPQVFERTLYQISAYYAKEKKFEATDDASLLEFAGFFSKAVDIGITNLKVTHPDDLIIATAIIESRQKADKEKQV
ncbi:MAG: 2-C-methyl-D-erythritol 4-phosphate cytidylyltransferase [Clostridia bacterium]|nr:2-C-methyl-D-erythritol 4-phosphate cytidylyltransferase [Clostridia bacterium]